MQRKTFEGMNCSVARALDQVGEWWTLLIVREAIVGTTRFDDFQHNLGIARNVLTARLNGLVEQGILEKALIEGNERRTEYLLTAKGEALYPVLVALMQWGDQWCGRKAPMQLVEHRSGKPIEPVALRVDGRMLGLRDIRLEPGPGATAKTMGVIKRRNTAILGTD